MTAKHYVSCILFANTANSQIQKPFEQRNTQIHKRIIKPQKETINQAQRTIKKNERKKQLKIYINYVL